MKNSPLVPKFTPIFFPLQVTQRADAPVFSCDNGSILVGTLDCGDYRYLLPFIIANMIGVSAAMAKSALPSSTSSSAAFPDE